MPPNVVPLKLIGMPVYKLLIARAVNTVVDELVTVTEYLVKTKLLTSLIKNCLFIVNNILALLFK